MQCPMEIQGVSDLISKIVYLFFRLGIIPGALTDGKISLMSEHSEKCNWNRVTSGYEFQDRSHKQSFKIHWAQQKIIVLHVTYEHWSHKWKKMRAWTEFQVIFLNVFCLLSMKLSGNAWLLLLHLNYIFENVQTSVKFCHQC